MGRMKKHLIFYEKRESSLVLRMLRMWVFEALSASHSIADVAKQNTVHDNYLGR